MMWPRKGNQNMKTVLRLPRGNAKFMRYFLMLFAAFLLLATPLSSFAQDSATFTSSGASHFFDPASNDQSIIYLSELFGDMPPVLAGSGGGSLLGKLFYVLNTAIMSLGIIFVAYTFLVGILNTAGEGEMLGKNWSSIWVPIRMVGGVALLIPTTSGYCVIQTFMMWILLQGVGAADHLTNVLVDYVEGPQPVFTAAYNPATGEDDEQAWQNFDPTTSYSTSDYDSMTKVLYQNLVCQQSLYKAHSEAPGYGGNPPSPPAPCTNASDPSSIPFCTPTQGKVSYNFYGYDEDNETVDCGYVQVNTITESDLNQDAQKAYEAMQNGTLTEALLDTAVASTSAKELKPLIYAAYIGKAYDIILPSLNATAYYYVNTVPEEDKDQDTFDFVGSDFLSQIESTYGSYMSQAQNLIDNGYNKDGYLEDTRAAGWASLGSIYWLMAKSSSLMSGGDKDYTVLLLSQECNSGAKNADNYCFAPSTDLTGDTKDYFNEAGLFIESLIATRSSNNDESFEQKSQESASAAGLVMDTIVQAVANDLFAALSDEDGNPMVLSEDLGHKIVWGVETAFTLLMITSAALAVGMGTGACLNPAFLVFLSILGFMLPPFIALTMYLLAIGGVLAVAVPMIPAVVYFLAVIGWLVSVVETMVAAPIVAIGVLHPEGHPVWGKAEPAIMLIANMFLRPSLIVIGMAAGVVLSFISLQVINFGFENAMNQVLGGKGPTAIELVLFISIYVGLVVAAVNKSFTMVNHLPEACMRWIQGGEATRFGDNADAMQKVQEQAGKGEQTAGELGREMHTSGEKAASKAGDAAKEFKKQNDAAGGESKPGGGDIGGG